MLTWMLSTAMTIYNHNSAPFIVTATVSRVGVLAPITKCTKQPKWDYVAVHDDMALT